jgi:hypothetical protein
MYTWRRAYDRYSFCGIRLKLHKLTYHSAQLAKISAILGVSSNESVENIPKPPYMRTKRYEALLIRYEKHQKVTQTLLKEGLTKWMNRAYKA